MTASSSLASASSSTLLLWPNSDYHLGLGLASYIGLHPCPTVFWSKLRRILDLLHSDSWVGLDLLWASLGVMNPLRLRIGEIQTRLNKPFFVFLLQLRLKLTHSSAPHVTWLPKNPIFGYATLPCCHYVRYPSYFVGLLFSVVSPFTYCASGHISLRYYLSSFTGWCHT